MAVGLGLGVGDGSALFPPEGKVLNRPQPPTPAIQEENAEPSPSPTLTLTPANAQRVVYSLLPIYSSNVIPLSEIYFAASIPTYRMCHGS